MKVELSDGSITKYESAEYIHTGIHHFRFYKINKNDQIILGRCALKINYEESTRLDKSRTGIGTLIYSKSELEGEIDWSNVLWSI